MSVSDTRLLEFAKYIESNAEVVDEIQGRVHIKLIKKFRGGTLAERAIISDLMDADMMFMKEVSVILAENSKVEINE
jgi:hypothetical protein